MSVLPQISSCMPLLTSDAVVHWILMKNSHSPLIWSQTPATFTFTLKGTHTQQLKDSGDPLSVFSPFSPTVVRLSINKIQTLLGTVSMWESWFLFCSSVLLAINSILGEGLHRECLIWRKILAWLPTVWTKGDELWWLWSNENLYEWLRKLIQSLLCCDIKYLNIQVSVNWFYTKSNMQFLGVLNWKNHIHYPKAFSLKTVSYVTTGFQDSVLNEDE